MNHNFFKKGKIMTIRNLTKAEILGQIKYLEQNISNGSVSYRTNRLNRLRALRASLRCAS
jgi:adenine C2-methylase RlmN of 23S rRNA A2503 and tRNA A37